MSDTKTRLFRIAALFCSMAIGLLLVEGIASAIFGRSLFPRRELVGGSFGMLDEERRKAALLTEGPYAVPVDPWIGNEFKADFNGTFVEAPWSTDSNRMRRRPRTNDVGMSIGKRILILGDSVAFGFGVEDHETLGAGLEDIVAAALANGTPRPEVRTLAVPGWNFANSRRALLDRLEEFSPDLVVYVPVENDLDDAYSVTEAGFRNTTLDIALGATRPHTSLQPHHLWRRKIVLGGGHESARQPEKSVWVLESGVSGESRRRYGTMIDGLVDLRRRLRGMGSDLVVVHYSITPLSARLTQYLAVTEDAPRSRLLFGTLSADMTLETDPHPNAATHRLAAIRLAKWLRDLGLLEFDVDALPEEDPARDGNRIRDSDVRDLVARRSEYDDQMRLQIGSVIDTRNGEGFHQVYGGIESDGMMGRSAWMALRHASPRVLSLETEAIVERAGHYPLELHLSIDGNRFASMRVERRGRDKVQIDLPTTASSAGDAPFDLSIEASNWSIGVDRGTSRLESVVISRIEVR